MSRPYYIPTMNGLGVVGLYGEGERLHCDSYIMTLVEAEKHLQELRRDAWNGGSKCQRNSALANCYLEWANSLSDALTFAAEQRAKIAEDMRSPAAGIVDRSAA